VTEQWVSGAVLAAICFGCWAAVLFIPGHVRKPHTLNYLGSLKGVLLDVWAVARSRLGFLALVIMVLPLASGGVPWSAISLEWKAGGDTVALVNGVAGGLAAAVGALVGGYVCDRMDVKRAYCVFAVLAGLVAAAMTLAPRGQATFVIFVLGYQFMIGAGYAGYVAIVLEAIGTRSAATNFNLMAALANVPIALMTTFDGWVHDKYGTDAMLFGELLVPIAAIIGFALLVAVTRRRRAVA
jgi:predicted MFS family arabinose efflux permease